MRHLLPDSLVVVVVVVISLLARQLTLTLGNPSYREAKSDNELISHRRSLSTFKQEACSSCSLQFYSLSPQVRQ